MRSAPRQSKRSVVPPGDVENKVFLLEQLTFPCGKQGSGDMPLLVGGVYQRCPCPSAKAERR